MTTVQEQLAVLNNKLDSFMTKSLAELAQALAASKQAVSRPAPVPVQTQRNTEAIQRPARPMYSVVCFECGEDCEIPFKPSGNRPVYCKACYAKRKGYTQKPSTPAAQTVSLSGSNRLRSSIISTPASKAPKKAVTRKTAAKKKASVKKKTGAKKKPAAKKKKAPKKRTVRKKRTVKKRFKK